MTTFPWIGGVLVISAAVLGLVVGKAIPSQPCMARRDILRVLIRQAARWLTAAGQDASPLIAILHLQYGLGYVWALKDIATADEIQHATGVDFRRLEREAKGMQDGVHRRVLAVCPQYRGDLNVYLAQLGGES